MPLILEETKETKEEKKKLASDDAGIEVQYPCGCWIDADQEQDDDIECSLCCASLCFKCGHSDKLEDKEVSLCDQCYQRMGWGKRRCGCFGPMLVTKAIDGTPEQWICFNCNEPCCYECTVYGAGENCEDLCETCYLHEESTSTEESEEEKEEDEEPEEDEPGWGKRRCGCFGPMLVTKAIDGTPDQWMCFNCYEPCCYKCIVYRTGKYRQDLCETCWVYEEGSQEEEEDGPVNGKRTAPQDQGGAKRAKVE
jgi:hypothetical protein